MAPKEGEVLLSPGPSVNTIEFLSSVRSPDKPFQLNNGTAMCYDDSLSARRDLESKLGRIGTLIQSNYEPGEGTLYQCAGDGDDGCRGNMDNALFHLCGGPNFTQSDWITQHPRSNLWELPHAIKTYMETVISNTLSIAPMIITSAFTKLFPIEAFSPEITRVMSVKTTFDVGHVEPVAMFGFPRLTSARREEKTAGFVHYYQGATIGMNFLLTAQGIAHFLTQIAVIAICMMTSLSFMIINQIENARTLVYESRKKEGLQPSLRNAYDLFTRGFAMVQEPGQVYNNMKHLLVEKSAGGVEIDTLLLDVAFDKFMSQIKYTSTVNFLSIPQVSIKGGRARIIEDLTNDIRELFLWPFQQEEAGLRYKLGQHHVHIGDFVWDGTVLPKTTVEMENYYPDLSIIVEDSRRSSHWHKINRANLIDACMLFRDADDDRQRRVREGVLGAEGYRHFLYQYDDSGTYLGPCSRWGQVSGVQIAGADEEPAIPFDRRLCIAKTAFQKGIQPALFGQPAEAGKFATSAQNIADNLKRMVNVPAVTMLDFWTAVLRDVGVGAGGELEAIGITERAGVTASFARAFKLLTIGQLQQIMVANNLDIIPGFNSWEGIQACASYYQTHSVDAQINNLPCVTFMQNCVVFVTYFPRIVDQAKSCFPLSLNEAGVLFDAMFDCYTAPIAANGIQSDLRISDNRWFDVDAAEVGVPTIGVTNITLVPISVPVADDGEGNGPSLIRTWPAGGRKVPISIPIRQKQGITSANIYFAVRDMNAAMVPLDSIDIKLTRDEALNNWAALQPDVSVNPLCGVFLHVFNFAPVTATLLHAMNKANLPLPIEFILARPHRVFEGLSAIGLKSGGETARVMTKRGTVTLEDDTISRQHTIAADMWLGFAIIDANFSFIQGAMITDYVGGSGYNFFGPEDLGRYHPGSGVVGIPEGKDIFVFAIPPGQANHDLSQICICGTYKVYDGHYKLSNDELSDDTYPTAPFYDALWKFTAEATNAKLEFDHGVAPADEDQMMNCICSRGAYKIGNEIHPDETFFRGHSLPEASRARTGMADRWADRQMREPPAAMVQ